MTLHDITLPYITVVSEPVLLLRRRAVLVVGSVAALAALLGLEVDRVHGMEWNGMEWNGMEWNGLEWNGMEWNGMEWNGMAWNAI